MMDMATQTTEKETVLSKYLIFFINMCIVKYIII